MPVVSMFYGVIILMYYLDDRRHHTPHIHARYAENEAVLDIETAEVLEGSLPRHKLRLVEAWIEIHRDDLMADWQLAVQGQSVYQIEPLR